MTGSRMRITYDGTADALSVELSPGKVAQTRQQGGGVFVDVDKEDKVLGIEVLDASRRFDSATLASLQSPTVYLNLAEAAEESGLSAGTLRVLLNNERLKGEKRGRDWFVTLAELDTYLESRAPAGRPAFKYKARRERVLMVTGPARKVFMENSGRRPKGIGAKRKPSTRKK